MKCFQLIAALFATLVLLTPAADAGRRGRYAGGGCSSGSCATASASACSGESCAVAHASAACSSSGCSVAAPASVCHDPSGNCAASTPTTPKSPDPAPNAATPSVITPNAALAEVNARRADRGLRPYIYDPALTEAARSAATYRARLRIRGHVPGGLGDFQFLPAGAHAPTAGCGALEPHWGFQTCAMYDRYTYAGAASVPGDDGLIYHHLFVR